MSLPMEVNVRCSQCGATLPVTVFESVNTAYAEDIPMQIITGRLFDVECPHCREISHLEYDVLYHDMNHNAMVWVIHKNGRTEEEYAAKIAEIRASAPPSYSMLRFVEDMNGLKEKVCCLERGRDDRVIELYKAYSAVNLYSQRPDFVLQDVFYGIDGGQETVYLYDTEGRCLSHELMDEAYQLWEKLYRKKAAEFGSNFETVDFAWAEETLAQLAK